MTDTQVSGLCSHMCAKTASACKSMCSNVGDGLCDTKSFFQCKVGCLGQADCHDKCVKEHINLCMQHYKDKCEKKCDISNGCASYCTAHLESYCENAFEKAFSEAGTLLETGCDALCVVAVKDLQAELATFGLGTAAIPVESMETLCQKGCGFAEKYVIDKNIEQASKATCAYIISQADKYIKN